MHSRSITVIVPLLMTDAPVHVNKSVQCGVVFDFVSHTVLNRHLAPHMTASLLPTLPRSLPDGTDDTSAARDNLIVRELRRQGLPNAAWRLSSSNEAYTLCDSYPSVLAVPATVNDDYIRSASSFRSKGEIPFI